MSIENHEELLHTYEELLRAVKTDPTRVFSSNYNKEIFMLNSYFTACLRDREDPSITPSYLIDLVKKQDITSISNDYDFYSDVLLVFKLLRTLMDIVFPEGVRQYTTQEEKKSSKDKRKQGAYGYIPSSLHRFIKFIVREPFYSGINFIDIGCGVGDKVIIAHALTNMNCFGLEHDFFTVDIGKKKINKFFFRAFASTPAPSLIYGDAFDHDFSKYDRIYTYIPVWDRELRKKFYTHIWSTVKKGTIWIEHSPNSQFLDAADKVGAVPLFNNNTSYFILK